MKACVFCGQTRSARRGLCWKCYLNPTIRVQYPSNQEKLKALPRNEFCLERCGRRVRVLNPNAKTKSRGRDRGLCSQCFKNLTIRHKYPLAWDIVGAAKPQGIHFENKQHPLPTEATDTIPGTEEKLQVMELRASLGQQLFHPNDAPMPRIGRKTYRLHLPPRMKHSLCLGV